MKNIYRILLIIVIIILILLSILICIKGKDLEKKEEIPPISPIVEVESVDEDVIIPLNSVDFFTKYNNARVESKEIYETINKFAKKIIPKYIKEISKMTDSEVQSYYEENKKGQEDFIEANDFNDFKKIVDKIGKYDEKSVVEKISFDPETIEVKSDYICAKLNFEFDNYLTISFGLKVYNKANENGKFILFYLYE